MAMLQQLQMEVQSLRSDVERLSGGVLGKPLQEEMPALPTVIPVVQPAIGAVVPAGEISAHEVHADVVSNVQDDDAIAVDTDYEEDLSIPNATDNLVRKALRRYSNKKDAADALGISERTLYRKIKELGLEED